MPKQLTLDSALLVSAYQASQMLGVTPDAVAELTEDGTLPSGRIGRRIVIRVADVHALADRIIPADLTAYIEQAR